MIKTKLTEMLGIKYPILGGTMMDISKAGFTAAISNAGALGILASAIWKKPEDLREELKKTKDLTDKPFAVNINLFPMMEKLDNFRYLDIMVEQGVKIVETSGFNPPADLIAKIKQAGMIWIHKCVGVRYAKKAEALGADAVTVVGYENGGATGTLNVTTLVLTSATVDAVKIPVIGGGGVVDGRTMLAVLGLGAEGVIVGSRFMLSDECPIHVNVKKAMAEATELDTDVIMYSIGFPHRVWLNGPAKKTKEIENKGGGLNDIIQYVSGEAARRMYDTGDLEAGTISCSQGIGLVHRIMPLKDIVEEMVAEAEAHSRRLAELGFR